MGKRRTVDESEMCAAPDSISQLGIEHASWDEDNPENWLAAERQSDMPVELGLCTILTWHKPERQLSETRRFLRDIETDED